MWYWPYTAWLQLQGGCNLMPSLWTLWYTCILSDTFFRIMCDKYYTFVTLFNKLAFISLQCSDRNSMIKLPHAELCRQWFVDTYVHWHWHASHIKPVMWYLWAYANTGTNIVFIKPHFCIFNNTAPPFNYSFIQARCHTCYCINNDEIKEMGKGFLSLTNMKTTKMSSLGLQHMPVSQQLSSHYMH